MTLIRIFLKTKFIEDGKLLWYGIQLLIILLAFYLRKEAAYGLALLIGGIYFGGYFTASFDYRNGAKILLQGSGFYQKKKNILSIIAAFIDNSYLGIAALILVNAIPQKKWWIGIVFPFLLYFFANAVGIIIGTISKNQIIGFLLCIMLSIFNFSKLLFLEEYFRWFSPVIQIGNMNRFQWWNQVALFIIALTIYITLIYGKRLACLVGISGIIIIAGIDIHLSANSEMPEEVTVFYRDIFSEINIENREHGLAYYEEIVIYKSVFYPWMSNAEKKPIYAVNDTLYLNCFTESLCNLERAELVERMILSVMKPKTVMQDSMARLYVQYLLGNEDYINRFLHEKQIEQFGEVISYNYGLFSEVLINTPERYGELYELVKNHETYQEIIEIWNEEVNR